MSSRSDRSRLQDILDAIRSIQARIEGLDFDAFCRDDTMIKAVLYDLIIIGEAANNLSSAIKTQNRELPWRLMSDMRNIVVHEYFRVNLRIAWSTARNNLPALIKPLTKLLQITET